MSSSRDSYRGVVFALLSASFGGSLGVAAIGLALGSPALLDAAVLLGIGAGVVASVVVARQLRKRDQTPPGSDDAVGSWGSVPPSDESGKGTSTTVAAEPSSSSGAPDASPSSAPSKAGAWSVAALRSRLRSLAGSPLPKTDEAGRVTFTTAMLATGVTVVARFGGFTSGTPPSSMAAGVAIGVCVVGIGLAATVVHYLVAIDRAGFSEAPHLARGARVVAWVLALAAVSVALDWSALSLASPLMDAAIVAVNLGLCIELTWPGSSPEPAASSDRIDLAVLRFLGTRNNILESILDWMEAQLGIDLRSTWALTVVRRSLEPLVIGLAAVGWLATAFTVVGVHEAGLLERFGVPVGGEVLSPGLHVHLPWPVDRVIRLPLQRVQSLSVGHETEEASGPEDVLWARQHAANEYTLLLGNGRDLITVDAAVQYRVADPRAWYYQTQNPSDALRALAYRAVMRSTVNKTLADALSENLVATTVGMRRMVQADADALGLGVEVLGFTVGGMHPPVLVAPDYQAVVSAELGRVTASVNAQVYRNRIVPTAETGVLQGLNAARAANTEAVAKATGEAWSFRTLQSQYGAAPQEFLFRRRLETLERSLGTRTFTVVDSRIQRDGGELWLTP